MLADVAVALDAAAHHGIVHRDVKPANVFLAPDGSAKLGDFGIARAANPALFRTAAGMLIGTPAYMSPESIQGEREPDRHGDDYSFAVMAYEMLVGVLPFRGEGLSLLGQHGFATPRSPLEIHPTFPAAAADALLAGLVKDPDRRLPAIALAGALRAMPAEAWTGVTPLGPGVPGDRCHHLLPCRARARGGHPHHDPDRARGPAPDPAAPSPPRRCLSRGGRTRRA
ncbi:MAG: protein kinase, partial [Geodermatophilaceae bacterium]|nr:protein kinase [Geodermatophilaceae bacterium]